MPRPILPACCLLLLSLSAARAEDAKPLATFPMGPDRMPFVTLSFGGKDYQCLIHSTASTTILHEAVKPALGPAVGWEEGKSFYALPKAHLGSLRLPPETLVRLRDLSEWKLVYGRSIDGLVGTDLMTKMAITLDYDASVVRVHEPSYRPTEPSGSIAITCRPAPHSLADVGGEEVELKIISTQKDELILPSSLVDTCLKHGAASVLTNGDGTRIGRLSATGFKGFRHESVNLGDERSNRTNGSLGLQFLARYNPTFRLANQEMTLAKSKWRDGHWWPELRGMTLVEVDGSLLVFSVKPDSPADRAGLEPNDEVDLPRDYFKCLELWAFDLPLTLNVRRNTTAYVATTLEGGTSYASPHIDETKQHEPSTPPTLEAIAEPLATFPMCTRRMPWANLSFGGKVFRCILDTGCANTVISARHHDELGPVAERTEWAAYYRLPAASIGSLRIGPGLLVECRALDDLSRSFGATIDGIVGMDILSRTVLSLNFDEGSVTLHAPDYEPNGDAKAARLYCMPRPYVDFETGGRRVLALVDTGSRFEFDLRKDTLHGLCERGDAILLSQLKHVSAYGVRDARWGLLVAGGWGGSQHALVHVLEQPNDDRDVDGSLGMQFLARYNTTLQFGKSRLLYSKSKWHEGRWWPQLRGMTIAEVGGRRIVFAVRPGSAAYRAGIRPDDEVDLPADFRTTWGEPSPSLDGAMNAPTGKVSLGQVPWAQMPLKKRTSPWETDGPLTLRVRKPGQGDFDSVRVARDLAWKIRSVAFGGLEIPELSPEAQSAEDRDPELTSRLKDFLVDTQRGQIEPDRYTEAANEWLVPQMQKSSQRLATLGKLESFELLYDMRKDEAAVRMYRASLEKDTIVVSFWLDGQGRIDGLQIQGDDK